MSPRGTGRFAIALVVVLTMWLLASPNIMAIGARAGGWGIGATLVLSGFGLALVFSAIYDGPRDLARLLKHHT